MPVIQIEQHVKSWSAKIGCAIRIKGIDMGWSGWIRVSAADLAAIGTILNESPVFFNTDTQGIYTGAEPPGEIE